MIVSILAYSSCDRSGGDPGEVGPIRFRYDSTGSSRMFIQTTSHDLPGALRQLADALEKSGKILAAFCETPGGEVTKLEAMGDAIRDAGGVPVSIRYGDDPEGMTSIPVEFVVPVMTMEELADAVDPELESET